LANPALDVYGQAEPGGIDLEELEGHADSILILPVEVPGAEADQPPIAPRRHALRREAIPANRHGGPGMPVEEDATVLPLQVGFQFPPLGLFQEGRWMMDDGHPDVGLSQVAEGRFPLGATDEDRVDISTSRFGGRPG